MRGELGDRGRPAVQLRQLAGRAGQLEAQFLQPPGHAHGPAAVAEVTLDLADDGRRGVGRELDAALGVEAVDGLDQTDGGDLDEVVQRLAAVAEPARQVLDEGQVHLDQVVTQVARCGSSSDMA